MLIFMTKNAKNTQKSTKSAKKTEIKSKEYSGKMGECPHTATACGHSQKSISQPPWVAQCPSSTIIYFLTFQLAVEIYDNERVKFRQ